MHSSWQLFASSALQEELNGLSVQPPSAVTPAWGVLPPPSSLPCLSLCTSWGTHEGSSKKWPQPQHKGSTNPSSPSGNKLA